MTATVLSFPTRLGPRQSPRRLARRPKCPVVKLTPKRDPEAAYLLYKQASAVDEQSPEEGLRLYERALLLDPQLHIARVNMGNCWFRIGETGLAEACYLEACEGDPNPKEALYNLGYLRLEDGRVDEAIALLRRSLECDPHFPDAHFNLGMGLMRIGKRLEAAARFDRFLELAPPGCAWVHAAKRHLEEMTR